MSLLRPSVEFAVQVVGELAQAEGECVLRTEDKYCKYTRSKSPLSPRCTPYFLTCVLIFGVFELKIQGEIDFYFTRERNT